MAHDTIPMRLVERAQRSPDEPAYFVKDKGMWQGTSWSGYAAEVRRAAKSLLALGVETSECVALIGGNRPEWSTLMIGAMSIGACGAGLYTTSSELETQAILAHAEARLVLVDSAAALERVRSLKPTLPALRRIIVVGLPVHGDPLALTWSEFLERGNGVPDARLRERLGALTADSIASLVYTSGAEGSSQGVLLSHRNLTWTSDVVSDLLHIGASDTSLSYLPLAHVSEQLFTVHGPVATGSGVYYSESTRSAPSNLREVQPTVVFGVPRIWEKLQAGMEARLSGVHGPRKRLVAWARTIATRVIEARNEGKEPSLELAAQYELAHSLVLTKIKRALGLGAARICISGAAPIDAATLTFFASIGLQLLEVYGQTESSGPIAMNQPRRTRFGSAGPRLPGLRVSIAPDGELLVAGPNVFAGYHRDPEASARALAGGFLHTGDLARIDAEGFLSITGRKRQILVTAGGKNVSPKRLEAALRGEELIREAVVIGDRRRYLSALVTIDEEVAERLGLRDSLHENSIVRERVARHIEALNARLGSAEQLRRHLILPRNFRIETGELTPTMKLRRHRIEELWSKEIEALYAETPEQSSQRSQ